MKSHAVLLASGVVLSASAASAAGGESLEARVARLEAAAAAKPVQTGLVSTATGTNLTFYGTIRVDAYKDFDYDMGANSLGFGAFNGRTAAKRGWAAHAYQTRLGFRGAVPTNNGDVKFNLETDFYGSGGGAFRIRHAYGEYAGFTVGQTWTNWAPYNPATMWDFDGLPGGGGYRAVQLRYTHKPTDKLTATFSVEEDPLPWRKRPVLTAALNYAQGSNSFKATAMSRGVKRLDGSTANGWGVTLSTMAKPWEGGSLQAVIAHGKGMSSMLKGGAGIGQQVDGLNARGSYDLDALGRPIGMTAYSIGVSHNITPKIELGAAIGYNSYDNFAGATPASTKGMGGVILTSKFRPNDRMTVGLEYMRFERKDFGGRKIDADRLLAVAQFTF